MPALAPHILHSLESEGRECDDSMWQTMLCLPKLKNNMLITHQIIFLGTDRILCDVFQTVVLTGEHGAALAAVANVQTPLPTVHGLEVVRQIQFSREMLRTKAASQVL